MYFSKQLIQKLSDSYYFCLFKLFKFNFVNNKKTKFETPNDVNNKLKDCGLMSFGHRVLYGALKFGFKIIHNKNVPPLLKEQLKLSTNEGVATRSKQCLSIIMNNYTNDHAKKSFNYVFATLFNHLKINLNIRIFEQFKDEINTNINIYFDIFIKSFSKFDVTIKSFTYILIETEKKKQEKEKKEQLKKLKK